MPVVASISLKSIGLTEGKGGRCPGPRKRARRRVGDWEKDCAVFAALGQSGFWSLLKLKSACVYISAISRSKIQAREARGDLLSR